MDTTFFEPTKAPTVKSNQSHTFIDSKNQIKTMAEKISINNTPKANELWKGIGGHFDTISQIVCEFIDNSISNFVGNNLRSKTIIVGIAQKNNSIIVSLEDSGTGIKNLDSAFCLGDNKGSDSPLNEHGFGMKHALASANPTNDNWQIFTRTKEDYDTQVFKKIESSYEIDGYNAALLSLNEENWPGELNGSGTYVRFECTWDLLYTLRRGISGRPSDLETLVKILAEDLGFVYSGLIQDNKATITIHAETKDGITYQKDVVAITPEWQQFYNPGKGEEQYDLGGGNVKLKYEFGAMKPANTYKYYKRNMSSSGLEIRINGRVLEYNLFKEVWGIERHNMYNHLLIKVDIISQNREALPRTRTSKNGLREGDGKFEKVLEWVRLKMPDPLKDLTGIYHESDLFIELEKYKKIHLPDPKTVTTEQNVYKNIKEKVPVDLYVHYQKNVIIYEGKKDQTTIQDVYQLKMYWDGCALDGIQPTQGILIASTHPDSVIQLVALVNQLMDFNGKNYAFEIKTWNDEGIKYPN